MNTGTHHRIQSLDILRSMAILWVLMAHTPFFIPGTILHKIAGWGSLGVNLFFVLSGYLIASQWFQELKTGSASYFRFFLRRAFRIWPNYFFMIGFFLLIFGEASGIVPLSRYFLFLQNFYPTAGFGISWSLCVEEHFYLLFPLLSLFAYKKGARMGVFLFLLFLAIGIGSRLALWLWLRPDSVALLSPADAEKMHYLYFYHPTFSRIDGLLFGVAIAALYRFRPQLWLKITSGKNWPLLAAFFLFFATVFIGSGTLGKHLPTALLATGAPAGKGLLPTAFATFGYDLSFALLLLAALSPGSLLYRARIPFSYTTAVLSFAIYLTHSEIIQLLEKKFPLWGIPSQGWLPITLMLVVVYAGAGLLYWMVEKPFLKLRDHALPVLEKSQLGFFQTVVAPKKPRL